MLDTSETPVDMQNIFRSKGMRTLKWFLWKACWPSTVILLFYPLHRIIVEEAEPFAHAFGHGDFLLLSFVLLLETTLDSEHLQHSKRWLEVVRQISFFAALLFTIIFAWSKFDLVVLLPKLPEPKQLERLLLYAQINCIAVLFAVLLGLVAYHTACDVEEQLALRKASE